MTDDVRVHDGWEKMTTSHGIDNDTAHTMRSCSRINLWLFNRLYCKQILTGGFQNNF